MRDNDKEIIRENDKEIMRDNDKIRDDPYSFVSCHQVCHCQVLRL